MVPQSWRKHILANAFLKLAAERRRAHSTTRTEPAAVDRPAWLRRQEAYKA